MFAQNRFLQMHGGGGFRDVIAVHRFGHSQRDPYMKSFGGYSKYGGDGCGYVRVINFEFVSAVAKTT